MNEYAFQNIFLNNLELNCVTSYHNHLKLRVVREESVFLKLSLQLTFSTNQEADCFASLYTLVYSSRTEKQNNIKQTKQTVECKLSARMFKVTGIVVFLATSLKYL